MKSFKVFIFVLQIKLLKPASPMEKEKKKIKHRKT